MIDGSKKIDFTFNLISVDSESFSIPENDYDARLTIDSSDCSEIFRDLSRLADTVTIEAEDDRVILSTNDDKVASRIVIKETSTTKIEINSYVTQSFAIRYLNMFNKATACSEVVVLTIIDGSPIMLSYDMGLLGGLIYYLAPKKPSDENIKKE